eukprot:1213870-Prymnesium_polylepis.1
MYYARRLPLTSRPLSGAPGRPSATPLSLSLRLTPARCACRLSHPVQPANSSQSTTILQPPRALPPQLLVRKAYRLSH